MLCAVSKQQRNWLADWVCSLSFYLGQIVTKEISPAGSQSWGYTAYLWLIERQRHLRMQAQYPLPVYYSQLHTENRHGEIRSGTYARTRPTCLFLKTTFMDRDNFLWRIFNFDFWRVITKLPNISQETMHLLGQSWSAKCPFWHNRLYNVVGRRIWSRLVAKCGRAEILKLLLWTGTFEILAKTLD